MCGLFAGVGKLSSNRMIALGSMNEERGTDSVGLAYLDGAEIRIAKLAERPCVGLNIALRKEVTEAAVSGLFIGHTRAATQGDVSSRNAHPFLMDGIAFAHNGIIINDGDFGTYEVDSESLIHGIKAKDFSKYEGPIALLWIEEGKLHAYRCGNPLARGRHNGSAYLASETDYLKAIGCTHVKELSEGMIYTFDSPFVIRTQRVLKNKTFSTSCIGTGKGFHHDYLGMTGYGWEERTAQSWKEKKEMPLLLPSDMEFPPPLKKSFAEQEAELIEKEDFRTLSDIAKELQEHDFDFCECCGDQAELSESRMCVACITWLDNQGVNRDNPPAWLKVH